ncbi:MAG: hypothetical protein JW873_03615 [Candidatus Saganbacteria bacterium]|nr:hypothetical protein [Candidatus Saganbacteria bacterium]
MISGLRPITYVGLQGPSGAAKSSKSAANRKSFSGPMPPLLAQIPLFSRALAANIESSDLARVPPEILSEGLRLLRADAPVFLPSNQGVVKTITGVPIATLGELVKRFENSLALKNRPLPSGWRLSSDRKLESGPPGAKQIIPLEERGISVKLDELLARPNLLLLFHMFAPLPEGDSQVLDAAVVIPGLTVIDSVRTDAQGRKIGD